MQKADTLVHGRLPRPARASELVLGRYRLIERLGAGGFGVVWRATDERGGDPVAVKRIPLLTGAGADPERAAREALAGARLAHPAIVALHEAGDDGEAFYLVSELVCGPTLADLIADDALSDREVIEIGRSITDALAHAHACGVIHRDVKPSNVLVPDRPGAAAAKLADFGGAFLAGEQTLTRTGDVVGTLAYMAPEQADGRGADEQADLYSLALVLYEALAGVNPVKGATPAATVRRVGRRVPSLAGPRPDVSIALARAIDRALDPAPEARGCLDDLAHALDQAPGDRTRPRRPLSGIGRRSEPARWDDEPVWRYESRWREDGDQARPTAPDSGNDPAPGPAPIRLPARLIAAAGAGALGAGAVWGMSLAAPAVATLAVIGASVAAVVAALPRIGWLAAAGALVVWLTADGQAGTALVIGAAAAPIALLRRPGPAWSVPALAPLLGAAGLAAAFPALAAHARGTLRRAVLGALGYWWLVLAEPLVGRRLWLGAGGAWPAPRWQGSLTAAAAHAVAPLLSLGVLAGAAVWALAAAVLPRVVRGHSAAGDLATAIVWSAAAAAAEVYLDGAHLGHAGAWPRGLVLGALAGALAAVALRAARDPG